MTLNLAVGCDLVHVPRIADILGVDSAPLYKIFHATEKSYCEGLHETQKFASYAARFAAKEAFGKALGVGLYTTGLNPVMVWVERLPSGKPQLKWEQTVQDLLEREGFTGAELSLSHDGEYALAFVTLVP
jgi:holo-[acyl-carrier protein] synthase